MARALLFAPASLRAGRSPGGWPIRPRLLSRASSLLGRALLPAEDLIRRRRRSLLLSPVALVAGALPSAPSAGAFAWRRAIGWRPCASSPPSHRVVAGARAPLHGLFWHGRKSLLPLPSSMLAATVVLSPCLADGWGGVRLAVGCRASPSPLSGASWGVCSCPVAFLVSVAVYVVVAVVHCCRWGVAVGAYATALAVAARRAVARRPRSFLSCLLRRRCWVDDVPFRLRPVVNRGGPIASCMTLKLLFSC